MNSPPSDRGETCFDIPINTFDGGEDNRETTRDTCHIHDFDGSFSSERAIHGEQYVWVKGLVLGQGSFGTVYEGLDQRTGRMLAVKEIRIDARNDADNKFKADLEKEIDICKDLKHPHLVSYFGHDAIDGKLYIYLEYMSGGSLAYILSQYGPLEEKLVQLYSKGLLEGLQYLHTRQPHLILHRDIKGANVLVGDENKVKLADFGCSKKTADTLAKTMCGSIPWMAPEVIMNWGYGRRSDVWSFGCTVIEMATAKLPWGGFANAMVAMRRIGMSTELPNVPDNLSEDCRDFIHQCLVRDKTLRPLAETLLLHKFVRGVDDSRTHDECTNMLMMSIARKSSAHY